MSVRELSRLLGTADPGLVSEGDGAKPSGGSLKVIGLTVGTRGKGTWEFYVSDTPTLFVTTHSQ